MFSAVLVLFGTREAGCFRQVAALHIDSAAHCVNSLKSCKGALEGHQLTQCYFLIPASL